MLIKKRVNITSEISEEHKLDIHKSSQKLIPNFALVGKTSIVNKLKQSKDLQQLVAQFMKDDMDSANNTLFVKILNK